jgi:hypothetical protein
LIDALKDPDESVRKAVRAALERLNTQKADTGGKPIQETKDG